MNLLERFEEKYTPVPESGCWLWTATGTAAGYGHIKVGRETKKAHRVSFELFKGEIPDGQYVCHKCDNPSCVNPDHLFLGSHTDNMNDRLVKGRYESMVLYGRKGEAHHNTKLTEDDVKFIRASELPRKDLMVMFSVSKETIRDIINYKRWRHVA